MKVKEILFKNWRNFSELNLNLSDGINIFIGKNAQGKTNILESVQYLSLLKSRASKLSELIKFSSLIAFVKINFLRADVSQDLAIEISAERKTRRLFVNGNATNSKNFIGRLNSVMFSPEDLFIFKGSPAGRRQFLDNEISQASQNYFENLTKYNKIVTQRNNLLKKIREGSAHKSHLELWTEQISNYAAKITAERLIAVENLNSFANLIHKNISASNENLSIEYEINGAVEKNLFDWYLKNFSARITTDIERGTTTFGPHHDDLKFFINGKELKFFGSQGQFRTTALSLKLSELEILKKSAGEYPVLLLDDVMSELDSERCKQLLIFLTQKKIQTLVTATDLKYFPNKNFGKVFEVIEGAVKEN